MEVLFAAADLRPAGSFSADELDGLPDPVRRYFETVLDEASPSSGRSGWSSAASSPTSTT